MSNLKELWLIGIPITDVGLANLQSLTDLERLKIRRTKITEKGFRNFCKTLPNCWTSGEYASFPDATQIRRISVWSDFPEKKRIAIISDPVQIAAIKGCLERCVDQYKTGWKREWDHDSKDSILIEIDGPIDAYVGSGWETDSFNTARGTTAPCPTQRRMNFVGFSALPQRSRNTVESPDALLACRVPLSNKYIPTDELEGDSTSEACRCKGDSRSIWKPPHTGDQADGKAANQLDDDAVIIRGDSHLAGSDCCAPREPWFWW